MSYKERFNEEQGNFYWSAPRVTLALLTIMLVTYGLGFLATGGDLAIYRFWAPKQENARRAVFVETQSYVQGKITYLTELQLAYEQSEGAQKAALRTTILREAAQIDSDKLPPDLRGFISTVKGGAF
jgi:hypothetical protein